MHRVIVVLQIGVQVLALAHRMLKPPAFPNDETNRVAGLLKLILLSISFVSVFDAVILLMFAPETLPTFWMNGLVLIIAVICLGLVRREQVRLASILFCLSFWVLLVYYLAISGGMMSPAPGILSVVPIMGAILLGVRGIVGFGLLATGTVAGLFIAGKSGLLISLEPSPTADRLFATTLATLGVLALLMIISARSVQDALARARRDHPRRTQPGITAPGSYR
jgi:hypothetical protein